MIVRAFALFLSGALFAGVAAQILSGLQSRSRQRKWP
jgi:hypothetical protein